MTEKRFSICVRDGVLGIFDNDNEEKYIENDEATFILLCELLNTLNDENKQLKSRVDDLEYQLNYVTKCKEMCFKDIEILDKKYEKLLEENEHIKQTIKDMINTERTEIGKMTLRQLWRQIQ